MRYKIIMTLTDERTDRCLNLCDKLGVAYYVDRFRKDMGMDGAYVHLMDCKSAIQYKRNGGIWDYYIPDAYWGVKLPMDI